MKLRGRDLKTNFSFQVGGLSQPLISFWILDFGNRIPTFQKLCIHLHVFKMCFYFFIWKVDWQTKKEREKERERRRREGHRKRKWEGDLPSPGLQQSRSEAARSTQVSRVRDRSQVPGSSSAFQVHWQEGGWETSRIQFQALSKGRGRHEWELNPRCHNAQPQVSHTHVHALASISLKNSKFTRKKSHSFYNVFFPRWVFWFFAFRL